MLPVGVVKSSSLSSLFSWIWASIIQARVAGVGPLLPASCSPWSVLVPSRIVPSWAVLLRALEIGLRFANRLACLA